MDINCQGTAGQSGLLPHQYVMVRDQKLSESICLHSAGHEQFTEMQKYFFLLLSSVLLSTKEQTPRQTLSNSKSAVAVQALFLIKCSRSVGFQQQLNSRRTWGNPNIGTHSVAGRSLFYFALDLHYANDSKFEWKSKQVYWYHSSLNLEVLSQSPAFAMRIPKVLILPHWLAILM